jgi:hypothetical protein
MCGSRQPALIYLRESLPDRRARRVAWESSISRPMGSISEARGPRADLHVMPGEREVRKLPPRGPEVWGCVETRGRHENNHAGRVARRCTVLRHAASSLLKKRTILMVF